MMNGRGTNASRYATLVGFQYSIIATGSFDWASPPPTILHSPALPHQVTTTTTTSLTLPILYYVFNGSSHSYILHIEITKLFKIFNDVIAFINKEIKWKMQCKQVIYLDTLRMDGISLQLKKRWLCKFVTLYFVLFGNWWKSMPMCKPSN